MAIPPWRGPGPGRPAVPLPPGRMRLCRGGRPLKRWTYVGAYGPDLMLCAARGRIGVVPFSWWAVWDGQRLHEGRRGLELEPSSGAAIEVVSPHGRQYAWTRKRTTRVRGTFDGRPFDLPGIVDESAGYHARRTSWRWSAGVGIAGLRRARRVEPRGGHPRRARGVRADGVGRRRAARSAAGAVRRPARRRRPAVRTRRRRARRENYLLIRSDYEQPFGAFAGELPGAGALREGWGVMERHDVLW